MRAIAETTSGRIAGLVDDGVRVFRGVRYGADTGGAARFTPPRRPASWAGVREALEPGACAPQFAVPQNVDPFYAWYSALGAISEDCLFLDLYTPGLDGRRRPVLFWIHGGGWREFSGTAPGFDGRALSRAEDVVVVTVNHRLSAFGFMTPEGSDERFADAGNAGLLDIVLALEWVRDNIAAFGGDPALVTIFGESGGASKIAALLSMKAAKGLFHRAILQSSAGGMRLATAEDMGRARRELANALGESALDCARLQTAPMATLVAALRQVRTPFRGMIDGRSFEAHPFDGAAPAIAADIPVMAGCTNTETTYHMRADPGAFRLDLAEARRRLAALAAIDEAHAGRIMASYREVYPGSGPSDVLVMASSDFVFKRNTYRIAALQAASARAPVYVYQFDRESDVDGGAMRAPHTCEVPFIFGTTAAAEACIGPADAPDVAAMTQRMMRAWASFARHGSPGNDLLPDWRPYRPDQRLTMTLAGEFRLVADPGGAARAAFEGVDYFGYGHALGALIGQAPSDRRA